MNRNIYRRIEVCFPLYEPRLKAEIRELLRLQLADTVAATPITAADENTIADPAPAARSIGNDAIRSQQAIYDYVTGLRNDPPTGN
jgi:polyphosphate kinase